MAELAVSGADTIKLIRPQAGIARAKTAVAAFIGRSLKGPVNRPVTLHSFEDYRRVFGGLWQPSTLSYAVEQFFENGGTECIVTRVCNGGRPPTLTLPAGQQVLRLIGRAPGTREYLRASIDYDGIAAHETDRFNLVVQRVRSPGSELVEQQESFRRLTILADTERDALSVLSESHLVRVLGELPSVRPDRSAAPAGVAAWVLCNADGDDGDSLSSYDLIGDALQGSGLFALRGAEPFNFLYVPPLTREADVGLPALLVALRLCRERQAMLLLDPPSSWLDVPTALLNLRSWSLFSEDALMFFPRILAPDRLRGRLESFGSAASAAGLIAQATERRPLWSAAQEDELMLRAPCDLATLVSDVDRTRLTQAGLNVLQTMRPAVGAASGIRTLLRQAGSKSDWRYASARRLALFITASIERGTRWALFEPPGPVLWRQLREQTVAFFESLAHEGAFVGRNAEENFFVMCDERLNRPSQDAPASIQLLIGFALWRPGDFYTCLVQHALAGSSVRPVSVNRYALPGGH